MEWLGAKGDGIQDDSPMFNKCHSIFNIRLLEKTYLLNNTVYIDVQKQCITGVSSRSILKSTCESPALFFHGTMFNSWNERNNRVNTHGNFTIISNKKQNAIVIGDQVGGEYEGHVDQQTFENIFVIAIYIVLHLII